MNIAQLLASRTEIIPLAPYDPKHLTQLSQAKIQMLWELYKSINKFEQHSTSPERLEEVKMNLV